MYNFDIRLKIKENRFHNYEIAKELNISEFTFSRWLRDEMSDERKQLVLSAIERIVRGEHNE